MVNMAPAVFCEIELLQVPYHSIKDSGVHFKVWDQFLSAPQRKEKFHLIYFHFMLAISKQQKDLIEKKK